MSTALSQQRETRPSKVAPNPAREFRQLATTLATSLLSDWVGADRAGEAIGRIGAALSSAAASAKKPEDFYTCTPASVGNCVAIAALTGIMPSSGSSALAYLVPRSPRRGEQKQLGFMFSHRGLNALAGRSGQTMIAIPISFADAISVNADGEVQVESIDFDNPPTEYEELRGVVVVVKRIESGVVVTRGWMPKKLIDKRRNGSDSYVYATKPGNEWAQDSDPWHKWPVEMAIKTAMHYAVSRGWCVIDDTSSVRALAADVTVDAISVRPHHDALLEGPKTLDSLTARLNGASTEAETTEDFQEQTDESTEALVDEYLGRINETNRKEGVDKVLALAMDDSTLTDEELQRVLAAGNDRIATVGAKEKA